MIPNFDINGNLPKGRFRPSMLEFENKFIQNFPNSTTRQAIFLGYKEYCKNVASLNVATKQWINGSYITQKENPDDIDLITHIDATKLNERKEIQEEFKYLTNRSICKDQFRCDAYAILVYPKDIQKKYDFYQRSLNYWKNWFGHDRDGNAKGVIEFNSLSEIFNSENSTNGGDRNY